MDYDETEMTEDEFDTRWLAGRPADIAKRPRDLNQLAKTLVDEATDAGGAVSAPSGVAGVTIQGLRLETGAIRTAAANHVVLSR